MKQTTMDTGIVLISTITDNRYEVTFIDKVNDKVTLKHMDDDTTFDTSFSYLMRDIEDRYILVQEQGE